MTINRQVSTIQRESVQRWVRPLMLSFDPPPRVRITYGTTQYGHTSADPMLDVPYVMHNTLYFYVPPAPALEMALDRIYDPEVDTDYPCGLGAGVICNRGPGIPNLPVLVRHNYFGFTDGVSPGDNFAISGTVNLTATGSDSPPGSPSTSGAYVVGSSPTGAWAGHAGESARWNGSSWTFSAAPASLTMLAYTIKHG